MKNIELNPKPINPAKTEKSKERQGALMTPHRLLEEIENKSGGEYEKISTSFLKIYRVKDSFTNAVWKNETQISKHQFFLV